MDERRQRNNRSNSNSSRAIQGSIRLAVLKANRTRREVIRRNGNRRIFKVPDQGKRPRLRRSMGPVSKGLASRFLQLSSGHTMLVPFLKKRFGWVESDIC